MTRNIRRTLAALALTVSIPCLGQAVATAAPANPEPSAMSKEDVQKNLDKIGTPEWDRDIQKLKSEGRITEINRTETDSKETTTYQVNDPKTGARIGDFSIEKPTTSERIGGTFDGGVPAVVFNQEDQKALASGGTAAVTAMAAAWAAALSETVVGSVISAGAISFVGGVAAVYVSNHGSCSDNRDLIVTVGGNAHCR